LCCQKRSDAPVGIFGGTFNPIHRGHTALIAQAHDELMLDKIIVIPSGNPPHKRELDIASGNDRKRMVELALEDYPYCEISDYEMSREEYSYSATTLQYYSKYYSNIYFIIGADSLLQLDTWYHPEIVMRYATIVAANRDAHAAEELNKAADRLKANYGARVIFIHMPRIDVSSSAIRTHLANGLPVDGMLDAGVEEYIRQRGLYRV